MDPKKLPNTPRQKFNIKVDFSNLKQNTKNTPEMAAENEFVSFYQGT